MSYLNKPCFIVLVFLCTWCIVLCVGEDEKCIKGIYHKDKPSEESDKYKFCTPWKKLSCCTTALDNEIAQNDAPKKYNDSWHLCGNLSKPCLKYWKQQECFYQCSPYVYKWQSNVHEEAIEGVPICADQCNRWYEACKNDTICVKDVISGYNKSVDYVSKCPTNKPCITYEEMYGSGENLCNEMWGSSYKYTEKNGNNCMKFWFLPGSENPNAQVGGSQFVHFSSSLLFGIIYAVIMVSN